MQYLPRSPLRPLALGLVLATVVATACGSGGEDDRSDEAAVSATACELKSVNGERVQIGLLSDVVRTGSGVVHDPGKSVDAIRDDVKEQATYEGDVRVMTILEPIARDAELTAGEHWPETGNEIEVIAGRGGYFDRDPSISEALADLSPDQELVLSTADQRWSDQPIATLHGIAIQHPDKTVEFIWPCPQQVQPQFERSVQLTDRAPDAYYLADVVLGSLNLRFEDLVAPADPGEVVREEWDASAPDERTLYFPGAIPDDIREKFRPIAFQLLPSEGMTGNVLITAPSGILLSAAISIQNPVIVALPLGEPITMEIFDRRYSGPTSFEIFDGEGDDEVFLIHIDETSVNVEIGSAYEDVGRVLGSDDPESYDLETSYDYQALFQP